MAYTVKYLSNFEFDNLPYKHAKEALGCADMRTKIAYVRRTGIPIADQFTTEHEIEELIAKHSDHEVDGIRYKKGGTSWLGPAAQIIGSINPGLAWLRGLGFAKQGYDTISQHGARGSSIGRLATGLGSILPIPFLQPLSAIANVGMTGYDMSKGRAGLLDMLGSGANAVSGPLGSTLSKMFNGAKQGFQASSGVLGKPIGAMQGMFGVNPSVNAVANKPMMGGLFNDANQYGYYQTTKNISPYGQFGSPSATSEFGTTMPIASNVPSAASLASGALGFGLGSNFGSSSQPQTSNQGTPVQQGIQNTGITQNSIGTVGGNQTTNAVNKTGLWDKIFGTGNMGKTMLGAAVPLVGGAFAPKVQAFDPMKSQLFTDVLARVKQGNMLQLTPEQRTAITARYDQELDTAKNNIMSRWRATRPGSDITNDTELQKAISDVETQYAKEKANAVVGTEIGLTQQQTSMLSELASLDIYSLAQASQVSVEEAKAFKEMLANMGFMVAGDTGNMFAGVRNMFNA